MSTGDCFIEVKYGTMVFDSALLIITRHIEPMKLAVACGEENQDPIYRRLTDSCGSFYNAMCELISECVGVDSDFDAVLKALPPLERRDLSKAQELMKDHFQEEQIIERDIIPDSLPLPTEFEASQFEQAHLTSDDRIIAENTHCLGCAELFENCECNNQLGWKAQEDLTDSDKGCMLAAETAYGLKFSVY